MIHFALTITTKADKDEAEIYKYISEEFGVIYADKFRKKPFNLFNLLLKQPYIGRPAKINPTLRVYLFNNNNKVVYKFVRKQYKYYSDITHKNQFVV
jgi:plasmid stabilization system protein ParE